VKLTVKNNSDFLLMMFIEYVIHEGSFSRPKIAYQKTESAMPWFGHV
jgi:hypothetical protein